MYAFFVGSHNIIRWLVILSGILSIVKFGAGWLGRREWTETDRKIGLFFSITVDIQILFGLLLFFVYSNWGLKAIIEIGMSAVMRDGTYRLFAIEHGVYMVLGLIFAHLGSALPKKAAENSSKFKRALFYTCFALVVIVAGIPWGSRPLFPGF